MIALIVTVAIEVPVDNQIKTWTVATILSDWQNLRDHWEFYHTVRTFASLAGITFFMTAIMSKRN